jgi:signal transduction histidine kinase
MKGSCKAPSTIRFHLFRLVLASVLPVWLITWLLVYHAFCVKRDQVDRTMLETARALTKIVDRELTSVQASLLALATSPSCAAGDLEQVQRQALQILKSYPDSEILLADASGQELMHTSRPFGAALPRRNNLESVRRVFQDAKPVVSGLYLGSLTQQQQVSVDVPVVVDGAVRYDLALTIRSDPMADILNQARLPADWKGLIVDSQQILVAKTANSVRSVGSKIPAALRQASQEGRAETTDLEGAPVLVTMCRSSLSNWSVVLEVPKSDVMMALYQWMAWAILGAAIISMLGTVWVFRYAQRIAAAIQSLVEPALSLGRAEMVPASGSYAIKETGEVASALEQASKLLQARALERDQAEQELLHTINDLEMQTRERLDALEKLSQKEQQLVHQGRQAAMGEMIGNIAQQWRQPLSALKQQVQQLPVSFEKGELDRKGIDDCVRRSLGLIQHLFSTIDDFRNFFRTDRQKVKFRVNDEVRRTLQLLEGSFARHRIEVEVRETDDPFIYGYPSEFSQVLLNILTNAKEELTKKAVHDPKVWITMSGRQGRVQVTIADNAGGIPEEIMDKIFDPYFTTKEPKSGTGVGLFMSKTLIEKNLGGTLSARNRNAGAEFSIEV